MLCMQKTVFDKHQPVTGSISEWFTPQCAVMYCCTINRWPASHLHLLSFCVNSLTSVTDILTSCCNIPAEFNWHFLWTVSSHDSWRFCHLPVLKPAPAPSHRHGKWHLSPETEALQSSMTSRCAPSLPKGSWQDPAVSCYQVTGMTRGNKES